MESWAVGVLIGAVCLVLGAGAVALIAWGLPKLRGKEQGYPFEAEIEALLIPFCYNAICSAFRVSEMAMDEINERLRGIDKKWIADTMYDLLPDEVAGVPVHIVKSVVSRERFRDLVQDVFVRFDYHFVQFEQRYCALFDEWKMQQGYPESAGMAS